MTVPYIVLIFENVDDVPVAAENIQNQIVENKKLKELVDKFISLLQAGEYEQADKLRQELIDKDIIKVKSSYEYGRN